MRGADYVVKRIAYAIVTVFVAITLNFVLFRALSGDAVSALRCKQCSVAFKEAQRRDLGLDDSLWVQYRIYLGDLARGDLGHSVPSEKPVRGELWEPIKNSLPMIALGTLFAIVVGSLVGVIGAWRRGTFADKGGLYTALAFYSMPTQWLGLMLIFFVASAVGLPTSGIKTSTLGLFSDASTWDVLVDRVKHMILPALTLGLVLYGDYALIVRSAMLETLGEDYVLTARAKGLRNWTIVWSHGLRNAMLPIITLVALSLGFIIGGSITVEYVFSYPGLGLLTVEAIDKRDFPLLQAIFMLLTVSVIFFNLIADLLYFKLDPRVTA